LTADFRLVSDPSLYSARFSGNQYTPRFLERGERLMEEKPSREYLSNELGKDSFSDGILMVSLNWAVRLKISFIPTVEFTGSIAVHYPSCPLQCRGKDHSLDVVLFQVRTFARD
jgi:hypothetical protein